MKHHQGYLLKELLVQANNAEEFEVMMNMGGLFMSADDGCYVGFLKPPDRQEMTDTEWKGSWYYDSFFETAQILRISCGLVRSRKTDADQVTQSPQIHLGTAALGCPGELPRQY